MCRTKGSASENIAYCRRDHTHSTRPAERRVFQKTDLRGDEGAGMQIHVVKNADGIEEWMMIEMQGTVDNGDKPLSDEVLGSLSWRRDDGEALLLVGHHLLEGKVTELEKPFLVVRSTPCEDSHSQDRTMTIEAVIKRRLVFRNRPKPLVTQTSSPS